MTKCYKQFLFLVMLVVCCVFLKTIKRGGDEDDVSFIKTINSRFSSVISCDKNIDIKHSANDAFLEYTLSCTLKMEILES